MLTSAHTHRPRVLHITIPVKILRALFCVMFVCAFTDARTFAQKTKRGDAARKTNKPAANQRPVAATDDIPLAVLLRIVRAEDERRYDADVSQLLTDSRAVVRRRAALAAGRIGDERAVPALAKMLADDRNAEVRAVAAFALGETELTRAARPLIDRLHLDGVMSSDRPKTPATAPLTNMTSRARGKIVEALGKIAAAIPTAQASAAATSSNQSSTDVAQELTGDARTKQIIGELILSVLESERTRRPKPDAETILLALTAALRARPANANAVVASYLQFAPDARVRADAANTLSRLRAKDQNETLRQALNDTDAIVRANAARALGAAGDTESFAPLLSRATSDADERVRTSSIRSLAALKDTRAVQPLVQRAAALLAAFRASQQSGGSTQQSNNVSQPNDGSAQSSFAAHPAEQNELLELASALGALVSGAANGGALIGAQAAQDFLRDFSDLTASTAPETEIAFARAAPAVYLRRTAAENFFATPSDQNLRWQKAAAVAQALATFAQTDAAQSGNTSLSNKADAQLLLRQMLTDTARPTHATALPEVLRALISYKPADTGDVLRAHLSHTDVIVRATAAELLAEMPPAEATTRALVAALPASMSERMNDAALAILNALAKQTPTQNSTTATDATGAIKSALAANDYLVRRRAAQLLKTINAGDYAARTGTARTRLTEADYRRALERRTKRVRAELTTDKGTLVIELLAKDAPLTVDNFIELARKGVFNNVTFHRVVPNFVVQTGDYVRGDGNGGPDYQIRCEINEVTYARGAVGMALSGKDTGGSQWFVTHSPQPHLDGGYTVFGRVVEGMTTIDRIARGDTIRSVKITETRR